MSGLLALAQSVSADIGRQLSHGTVPVRVPRDSRNAAHEYPSFGTDGTAGTCGTDAADTVARWLASIEALPAPCSPQGERLLRIAHAFLASPLAPMAALADWTDAEIFGVCPDWPSRRIDRLGLVPLVSWSRLPGSKVIEVNALGAVILTRLGSLQTFKRETVAPEAVPFWQCPALIGEPIVQEVAA